MSAGAQPRLQKTEPWELIQAFAEAMDRNTLQQADLRNRREIQEMKESGEDRRLERGSQLALDRLSGELKLKEPYQQRAEERGHGYDLDKMNKQGDITRQNYKAYGDESMRQHQANRTFDINQDLEYGPRQREAKKADLLSKEDVDKLAQQRRNELDFQDAQRRDQYARSNRPADDEHTLDLERRKGGIQTDEAIKLQERMTPEIIKRDTARQEAIGTRRLSEAELKAAAAAEKSQSDAAVKTSLQILKGNQGLALEHLRQFRKAGAARLPAGVIAVDPAKKLAHKMNGVDYDDPSQFIPGGIGQNPFDPKLGSVQFYTPKNPLDPALLQALQEVQPPPPPQDPPSRPYQDLPVERPPETVQPAIPVTPLPPTPAPSSEGTGKGNALEQLKERLQGGAPPPSSNFGIDDLKRGNQSSLPDEYQSPLEKLRTMVASADPYQSFREASANIGQLRPQSEQDRIPTTVGNTTTVQKGVQADANSPRGPVVPDIAAPVTTGTPEPVKSALPKPAVDLSYNRKPEDASREIHPDRAATWRKTADEAPPELRDAFDRAGKKYNLSPNIIASITHQESSWKPDIVSGKTKSYSGATGIGQFMPPTAKQYKVNPYDVESSVDGVAHYMSDLLKKYDGNLGLAAGAYNAGPGNMDKYLRGERVRSVVVNQMRGYVSGVTGRPVDWWASRRKQGGSQVADMIDVPRNGPLPPARPDNLTTVAKGEQQPADEEAAVQEAPTVQSIPAMRPPDAQITDAEGTPGNTLTGLPFEGAGTRPETKALIFHHTGSPAIRSVGDTRRTLERRGLGIQYIMERDGTIHQMAPDLERASHIKRGRGVGEGLSNQNTIGIEIVANDDSDVTPAQVESAKNFYRKLQTVYPGLQVFGHGEINKHKQRTEGGSAARAARQPRVERTNNPDLFYVDV